MATTAGAAPTGIAALEDALRSGIGTLSATGRQNGGPDDVEAGTQPAPGALGRARLQAIFDAQATSRHLDVVARELQSAGEGFYTIGSAGHEGNAVIAAALRLDDPALLHYRSGAFYLARAAMSPGSTPIADIVSGMMALADEPIAGGRHKVFGNKALHIIPQTSTVASHLPRAVGLAIALPRAHRLAARAESGTIDVEWPPDAVVACSFGDASANHSTTTGAINTAVNAGYRGLPVPIVFICEDNGYGISVPTASGWIQAAYGSRPGLDYFSCEGTDPGAVWAAATEAARRAREQRRPAFLHLRCARFLGHAGSDAEIAYRSQRQIAADYAADPLLGTARALAAAGEPPDQILARYDARRADIDAEVSRLRRGRRLSSAAEVMAPLAPRHRDRVLERARKLAATDTDAEPNTLAESINATLDSILDRVPGAVIFGEDVGVKGGVYGLTRGLARRHGAARVFDSVLDEQSILGLGLGAGLSGLLPIPEIQYLAYLHNAIDQLRGEAATQQFFSTDQYRNPMIIRLAGLSYQKGFGGHFHNDNAVASLRDIPGVVVGCPSRGDDAAAMLRTLAAAGLTDGTVSVFLEPIALYHRRDLYADKDNAWLAADRGDDAPIGTGRMYGTGQDLTMITFGNGVPMSLQAARHLAADGIHASVLDLRWLAPLPAADIAAAAKRSRRILVADETRHSGGVGEGVVTALVESGYRGRLSRVSSMDSFVPLGPAADHVLLSVDQIETAARKLAAEPLPDQSAAGIR
jgi:2-oxoisovalerate dehydrogenase E1 component